MNQETAKTVINKVLCTNFKSLSNTRIKLVFDKGSDYYMAVQWKLFYYILFIDAEILRFSEPAFKGCLSHELIHILQMEQLNLFKRIKSHFNRQSQTEKAEEERRTDLLVIQHGLGKELLQFHEEHNRKYKSYKRHEGLTKFEIKKILRKIKA
jgi:hypothetical protein